MLLYGNFTRFFQAAGFYRNRRFSIFLCFYNTFSIYGCNLFIRRFICKFCHILWRCLCFDAPFFAFFQGFLFRYTRNFFYPDLASPVTRIVLDSSKTPHFAVILAVPALTPVTTPFSSTAATFGLEELHSTVSSKESLCVRD